MTKYSVLWCVVLPMVQLLVGCNSMNPPQSSADCACKSPPKVARQAPSVKTTKMDTAKIAAPVASKTLAERKPPSAAAAAKTETRVAKDETPQPGFPVKEAAKIATKEPPIQEPAIVNRTTATPLPELKLPPPPIPQGDAPIIRSVDSPTKIDVGGSNKEKVGTIAQAKHGASADYSVLVGRVQEWRKTLRLRYTAVEKEDTHGGSVMLEGGAELDNLRDGQHIRVRGKLIPAEDRITGARYRVDAIEILN